MANTAGTTRRTTLCWTQAEIKELLLMKLGTECKISQYTDDTTFILDGSQSSFSRSLYLLDSFGLISGLKVNYAKTEGLWIGSCKSSEITLPSLKPILWAKDKVWALRVWFSTLEDTCTPVHVSFLEKLDKLQSILNSWSVRRLTLLGKITIIKSLAMSQIVYLLSSLTSHQKVVHEKNSILYDFLWDSKGNKIEGRTKIINDYDKGGLKMIDIQSFNASLKMKWVQSYLNTENKGTWNMLFDYYLERYSGKLLFLCNLKQKDASRLKIKDPF